MRATGRILLLSLISLCATFGIEAQGEGDRQRHLSEFLTWCDGELGIRENDFPGATTDRAKAVLLQIESDDPWCGGVYLEVTRGDQIYIGQPWILGSIEGDLEQKIETYAWQRRRQTATAALDSTADAEGLVPTRVSIATEWGKIELDGLTDREAEVFYPGGLIPASGSFRDHRLELAARTIENAPALGSASRVELVEFSDFQCPSCQRASGVVDSILEEFGDQISYRRVDFPLIASHPWALPAAIYGRAIHRQDPSIFWDYKREIFDNQGDLNAFTLEDFTRSFIQAQGLDPARFDRDVASEELREEILSGIASGMMAEIRGTPAFWINGQPVALGADGATLRKALRRAIADTSERQP